MYYLNIKRGVASASEFLKGAGSAYGGVEYKWASAGERERARAVGGRVHDVTLELSSTLTAVVSTERSLKSDAPSETQRYPGDLNRYSPPPATGALSIALDLLSPWIIIVLYPFHEDVRRFFPVQNNGEHGDALVKTR